MCFRQTEKGKERDELNYFELCGIGLRIFFALGIGGWRCRGVG